jgi:lipid-binding SYLF domain-containing protein
VCISVAGEGYGFGCDVADSLTGECKKTGKILASFVDPRQAFGPDKIIPPQILANAKGLAILTVFKAGFLGTARFGSGIVVARLADGSWSAPSAIGQVGGGFGGQIGFELTDFVFILNDAKAVTTFAQAGSLTLGGNVSIAAGPVGRNAEAAGAASMKGVAGIFSYSKTKGLFAGVSLEGSGIIERRDANEKLYGRRWTARELLSGQVAVPPSAEPLMRVLNSRVFAGVAGTPSADGMYNDIPVYADAQDDVVWQGRRGSAYGEGVRSDRTGSMGQGQGHGRGGNDSDYVYSDRPSRASTWNDDLYDHQPSARSPTDERFPNQFESRSRASTFASTHSNTFSNNRDSIRSEKPSRPTAPKPVFNKKASLGADQAIAKFTFDADQPGDLGFKKGDVITILKRTDNETDWWTGRVGDREGIFPSNYVETV